ncbi:MAG: purine-nucleoside phosphorylase [Planctomycetia bacterium]|nr:purine-nucleoside phosphorylase [Planctomycetia bacterium]
MTPIPTHTDAAAAVRAVVPRFPEVAVVLGSGLGPLADRLADRVMIAYAEIPGFPAPTVAGHHGNLVVGSLGGARVAYLQGRFHYYEGHDLSTVTFPVRVLKALGVGTLVLTAATGGINADFRSGDIVCLSDHLNLIGQNPLRGDRTEPRFPDMSEVYSRRLREIAGKEAGHLGLRLRSGVYACLPGPSYETPAEIRMLRTLGADVVGMSTVPEAIVARQSGMEVLAFALVTNAAAGVTGAAISHEDVLEAGRRAVPRLGALIEAVVRRIGSR